mgnify:FL=1|jgi:hypothetical protein
MMTLLLTPATTLDEIAATLPGWQSSHGFPEDEMTNYNHHEAIRKDAAARGVTVDEARQDDHLKRTRKSAVRLLLNIAFEGESSDERSERIAAHLAAQPLGPPPTGRKRPCKHNSTKKDRGWYAYDALGKWGCFRCGAEAPAIEAVTTEQAHLASKLVLPHAKANCNSDDAYTAKCARESLARLLDLYPALVDTDTDTDGTGDILVGVDWACWL